MKLIKKTLVIALVLATTPALAQQSPAPEMLALRPEATITGDKVRLGDLVTGAGVHAATPLFRAPLLGGVGAVKAEAIAAAALELGLQVDVRGLSGVIIRRPAREITADQAQGLVAAALARRNPALAGAQVTWKIAPQPLAAAEAEAAAATAEILLFDPASDRFTAHITAGAASQTVEGVADARIPTPVLVRPVMRGDTVQAADLGTEPHRKADLGGVLTDPRRIIGQVARRPLRAGQPLRDGDIVRVDVVERNQLVAISYEAGGMVLTSRGKAMAGGGAGQVIQVQNLHSKRAIDALITGPGRVSARLGVAP